MEAANALIVLALVMLILFLARTGKSAALGEAKPKEQKQREIIEAYKAQLDAGLAGYEAEARTVQKTKMLTLFSHELSNNLFFDHDEVREAIRELAHYEPEGSA